MNVHTPIIEIPKKQWVTVNKLASTIGMVNACTTLSVNHTPTRVIIEYYQSLMTVKLFFDGTILSTRELKHAPVDAEAFQKHAMQVGNYDFSGCDPQPHQFVIEATQQVDFSAHDFATSPSYFLQAYELIKLCTQALMGFK